MVFDLGSASGPSDQPFIWSCGGSCGFPALRACVVVAFAPADALAPSLVFRHAPVLRLGFAALRSRSNLRRAFPAVFSRADSVFLHRLVQALMVYFSVACRALTFVSSGLVVVVRVVLKKLTFVSSGSVVVRVVRRGIRPCICPRAVSSLAMLLSRFRLAVLRSRPIFTREPASQASLASAFKYLLARATRRPSAAALSLGVLVACLRGSRNRRRNCRRRSPVFGRDLVIAHLSTAA